MKKYLLIPISVLSIFLAGCGPKSEMASAPSTSPIVVEAKPSVVSFEITAGDTMKFNLTRLEVAPGQDVAVTLVNTGKMPKAAMGHNWVLLKKGVDVKAYADAAVLAMATEYLPASKASEVVAATKLLGPKQSEEVKFKAPSEPGEYVFLCTFPAHFASGMKGVLVVR